MKKIINAWLSVWLYVISAIGLALLVCMVVFWDRWTPLDVVYILTVVVLILHVLEEWWLPGGFHYGYNLNMKSDMPDRYPMNRLSDMLTNLIPIVAGCVILIIGVPMAVHVGLAIFAVAEVVVHTTMGKKVAKLLSHKGKSTIYNPGLYTSLFGFLPVAVVYILLFIFVSNPTIWQVLLGIVIAVGSAGICTVGIETLVKSKNTSYPYPSKGYYTKFDGVVECEQDTATVCAD